MMVAILKDEDWHKLNINNKPTAQSNNRELMWHQVTSNKQMIERIKEELGTKNPAHYCMGCNKWLGFRGFCSTKCHNKFYNEPFGNDS